MNNRFGQILKSLSVCNEDALINEFNGYSIFNENCCCFLFDVKTGRCCYLCPSIKKIIGYTNHILLKGNFLFIKSIIDPGDFPLLFTEIITLIKSTDAVRDKSIVVKVLNMPFHIRHKNGQLLKLTIHCICIKDTLKTILAGLLNKEPLIEGKKAAGNFKITSREIEVLKLLASGKTAKTIASELFISENTVITHRKHLIQKLNVKNSVELVKKSLDLNILC